MAVVRTVICFCVLLCPLPESFAARVHAQTKPSLETSKGFRFKVTDSENNLPIPEATVSLFYWRRKDSAEEKKEIELKTDKNGIAEFPSVKAEKFAVSVLVKGYKPCWRWIRSNRSEELIRMRLEKWASTPK
jgi:transposase